MEKIKAQLIKPQMFRRIMMVLIAHVIMGFAVALLKLVVLGTDPFAAMMMSLTAKTTLSYGLFCLLANCSFFVIEIIWGRQYIGIGSIVNWFLLGYSVMFWNWMVVDIWSLTKPELFIIRLLLCLVAIVLLAFSLSLYQSADIGSSPYDSMPLVMHDHLHLPFFAARVLLDAFALTVALLAGGIIGIGTAIIVFCLGPICQFFNTHFSEKLITKE